MTNAEKKAWLLRYQSNGDNEHGEAYRMAAEIARMRILGKKG